MAHKLGNRRKETTSTTGVGAFTTTGAVAGHRTLASRLTADGDTSWYTAVAGTQWESGLLTRTSSTTFARTTIYENSNGDTSPVNFTTAPILFLDLPAEAVNTGLRRCAFKAYRNGDQTGFTTGVTAQVQMNAETMDGDGCFDTATGQYTPKEPGLYQVNWSIYMTGSPLNNAVAILRKNGAVACEGSKGLGTGEAQSNGTDFVQMNGTTDYLDIAVWMQGSTLKVWGDNSGRSTFSAYLAVPDNPHL